MVAAIGKNRRHVLWHTLARVALGATLLPIAACPDGGPAQDEGLEQGGDETETTDTSGEVCVYPDLGDTREWEFYGTWDVLVGSNIERRLPNPTTGPVSEKPEGHRLLAVNPRTGEVYRSRSLAPRFDRIFPDGLPSQGPVPRDVIGGDDRKWVEASQTFPFTAMAALMEALEKNDDDEIVWEEDNQGCSGAFIGPRHVLTAAHCLQGTVGEPPFPTDNNVYPHAVIRGRNGPPGQDVSESAPYGLAEPALYFIPEGWIDDGFTDRFDYALAVLDCADESPVWLGMAARTAEQIEEESRTITGYPGALFDCADTPFSDAQCAAYAGGPNNDPWPDSCCGSFMYTQNCDSTVLTYQIAHSCDTESGQSGAPHYGTFDGDIQVIGNHTDSGVFTNASRRMRVPSFNSLCDWIGKTPSSGFEHGCF